MNSNRDYATENINLKKRLEVLETSVLEYKDQEQLYWQTNENNVKLRQENEKLKKEKEQIREWVINKIKYLDKGVFLMSGERVKGAIEILNQLLKEVMNDE